METLVLIALVAIGLVGLYDELRSHQSTRAQSGLVPLPAAQERQAHFVLSAWYDENTQ